MSATLPIYWRTGMDGVFSPSANPITHYAWPLRWRRFDCGHKMLVTNKLPFELNNHAKCFCCRMLEGK